MHNLIRLAIRRLARHKTFSLINIGGLAVSLASCIFIFYFVYDEFTYDRFHEKSDRIYRLTVLFKTAESTQNLLWTHQKIGPQLKRVYPQVEEFVRIEDVDATFNKVNKETKGIVKTDPSVFNVFTFPLIEGNPNTALLHPYSIVISESLAKKHFHGMAIGQLVEIDKEQYTVTAVMRDVPSNTDKWVSGLAYDGKFGGEEDKELGFAYQTYILLNQGEDPEFIRNKLLSSSELMDRGGEDKALNFNYDMQLLTDLHFWTGTGMDNPKGNEANTKILAIVACVLLLVALFNFINLTTVFSLDRAKEVGVRKAAGAQKGQLVRQFLGESIVTVMIAAAVAFVSVLTMNSMFTRVSSKQIDLPVVIVTLLLLILTAILSSIYPASILSSYRPLKALRNQKEIGGGNVLRRILTTAQFGLSTALLIFLTTVLYQTDFMRSSDLGFEKEKVVVLNIPNDSISRAHTKFFVDELRQIKSVSDVGVGGFASTPGTPDVVASPVTITVDGQTMEPIVANTTADKHYTSILGLNAIEGKSFHDLDDSQVSGKAIINQSFAKFAGWKNPIGNTVHNYFGDFEIIGIVPDFHFQSLHSKIEPMVIVSQNWDKPDSWFLFVKMVSNDVDQLRTAWQKVLPDHPFDYTFLNDYFDAQYKAETTLQTIFLYFTILTIIIAGSGLLGLTIHHVEKKTKEISIRKVLGAPVSSLIKLLSKEFLYLTVGGVFVGSMVGSMLASQWLTDYAYHIEPGAQTTLLPVSIVMGIALAILVYKTFQGSNRNPIEGLKHE